MSYRDYLPQAEALLPALMMAESGGNPNAVSSKGAFGKWQLMPSTAASPGFGVDPLRDKSEAEQRRVSVQYLAAMLDRYNGDETKALAAYNAGPGAVDKYGGIPPFAETQAYVKRIQKGLPEMFRASQAQPTQAAAAPAWQPELLKVQTPEAPANPAPPEAPQMSDEEWAKQMERMKQAMNLQRSQDAPPGMGDMSSYKAGFGGLANPGFQDMSGYAEPALQGLMGLLLSGKLGGQLERKRIFNGLGNWGFDQ